PIGDKHPVCLAVVNCGPVSKELRYGIWRARGKWCRLVLWSHRCSSEELGGRGLIHFGVRFLFANGLEQPQSAYRIDVRRVLWHLKAHLNVALAGQVIDLIGLYFTNNSVE